MDVESPRLKRQDSVFSSLNAAIDAVDLVEKLTSATPAKAVFGSVSALLTMIKVRFPPLPRWSILGSHATRTPWQTKLSMSSSG